MIVTVATHKEVVLNVFDGKLTEENKKNYVKKIWENGICQVSNITEEEVFSEIKFTEHPVLFYYK